MKAHKLINLTGRLLHADRLRSLVVVMVPVWLLLPFAPDLARQLPPLTIKVYAAADGNMYLQPVEEILTQTGASSIEPQAQEIASTLVDSTPDQSGSIEPSLGTSHPGNHDAQPSQQQPLWHTPIYPVADVVKLMQDYAFTSQLSHAAGNSVSRVWSVSFDELSTNKLLKQLPLTLDKNTDSPKGFLSARLRDHRHLIVLDPGHGGSDPGTIGPGGMQEKLVTLDIAKRVQKLAHQKGEIKVVLTRNQDAGFARAQRVSIVQKHKPDLLLSLHLNNLPQKDLVLVETFYTGLENLADTKHGDQKATTIKTSAHTTKSINRAQASKKIAEYLQKYVYQAVKSSNSAAINAGVKKDKLFMLSGSQIPGALIELSCLSNAEEEERLKSGKYREQLAKSLLQAIEAYFRDTSDLPSA